MNSESYKYKSTDIAKYIIARANEAKLVMNMTKLQKLLYVAYGVYMFVKNERLTDENPQAWPYGPVFPTTRNQLLKVNFENTSTLNKDEEVQKLGEDSEIESLVDLVFRSFGTWSAGQLTEWSHAKDSPWERTQCVPDFKWGQVIPDEYIKEYFSKILVKNE